MQTEDVNVLLSNEDIAMSVVKSEKKLSDWLEKPIKTSSLTQRFRCPMISPRQDYDSLKEHLECRVAVVLSKRGTRKEVDGVGVWCEDCTQFLAWHRRPKVRLRTK